MYADLDASYISDGRVMKETYEAEMHTARVSSFTSSRRSLAYCEQALGLRNTSREDQVDYIRRLRISKDNWLPNRVLSFTSWQFQDFSQTCHPSYI